MAARDDSKVYEATIDIESERGKRWMDAKVGNYLAETSALLHMLNGVGITTEQVDEHHKAIAKQIISQIISESRNAFEQAALTAMVGTSLLATFDAQMDLIELQMDIIDAEGGGGVDR